MHYTKSIREKANRRRDRKAPGDRSVVSENRNQPEDDLHREV